MEYESANYCSQLGESRIRRNSLRKVMIKLKRPEKHCVI